MKNTLLLLIAIMLGFASCEPINEPEAGIGASQITVAPYENIEFYNYSKYANSYEWNFGNGDISYDFEPVYNFDIPGLYDVRLSAYKNDMVSYANITIRVLTPNLDIQVIEITDGYVVSNAKVILYPSYSDWVDQTNQIAQGYTNQNGLVAFCNLSSGFYYMDISNSNHDNYLLEKDDVGFIKTPYIGGAIVYTVAYVDYYTTKSANVNRKIVPNTTTTKRIFSPEKSLRTLESK